MNTLRIETKRLILREFIGDDIEALYMLLKDEEVNFFLPWFPLRTLEETRIFFEKQLKNQKYYLRFVYKKMTSLLDMSMSI